jgi:hypothetical protein
MRRKEGFLVAMDAAVLKGGTTIVCQCSTGRASTIVSASGCEERPLLKITHPILSTSDQDRRRNLGLADFRPKAV